MRRIDLAHGTALLRLFLGGWLLHLSASLALRGSSRLLLALGLFESVAALLFGFRRTVRWGAALLLLSFAFASGFHLRAGEQPAPLFGYALAVVALTLATGWCRSPLDSPLSAEDRTFLRAFETTRIAPDDFHHREHIRAAWAALCQYPLSEALGHYSAALRRIAARAGKPGIYHETITCAYLVLIHERLERDGRRLPFAEFAQRNPDLLTWEPSVLSAYYRPEVLHSEHARQVFVLPRAPAGAPQTPERAAGPLT